MRFIAHLLIAFVMLLPFQVAAGTGVTELNGKVRADGVARGPVTVFYPSSSPDAVVERGPFSLQLAWQGVPVRGNGRLIAISHGSGGSPWPQTELARAMVAAGFIVAIPEHQGDNWRDLSKVGPPSWKERPAEISDAIDLMLGSKSFGPLLEGEAVGVYGMSAGGHTALSLAGGRWSPARLKAHCAENFAVDFQTCIGPITRLRGDALDPVKILAGRIVQSLFLRDTAEYTHEDLRVKAIVSEVPFAADFDMASLIRPRAALGLVRAGRDIWLLPQFHIDRVRDACSPCELIVDLPDAGHGSLLSPQPTTVTGVVEELLRDPPGFDRRQVPQAHERIVRFFLEKLGVE